MALRAVRDSAEAFPPLKSAAAAVLIVWDMSEKAKSNKEDCKRLARRATEIVSDIWRQTKDYGVELPVEVRRSVDDIEMLIRDAVILMKELKNKHPIRRLALQDDTKSRIEEQTQLLDEAIQRFDMNLQISVLRLHTETSLCMKGSFLELDDVCRERHDEVLVQSRMSAKERELLSNILDHIDHTRFGVISIAIIFF